jgi:hypothetical protein
MHALWLAAGIALAALAWTTPAFAQVTSPLIAPVAQGSTEVPYPAGGHGDASVTLELIVEKDGSVSSALVVEGEPPFSERAQRAVLAWRFSPALRGDTPVAARIRARVAFHQEPESAGASAAGPPPTAAASGSTRETAGAAATPPALPAEPPLEVTVLGERRELGQTTLLGSDVREMPGAFGDSFRAIEALPGVAPLISGLPYFSVRGAPANDNGYYVDGVRVPLLFHLGVGQSVIHPGLIERVDFFPGSAPASYGASVGAIIAGQTRAPAATAHGEANLRLFDAGTLLETPFADGRGSVLVAGRYGYPGPILSAVSSDLQLGYWDYQARATFRFTERDSIGMLAFGSHDYLASRDQQTAQMVEQFRSDFARVDLRYDHAFSAGQLRVALTGGYDSQGSAPTFIRDQSLAARLSFQQKLADNLQLRAGAEAHFDAYGFRRDAISPTDMLDPSSADPPPRNLSWSGHADMVWRVTPSVELVPGARVEVFESSRAPASGSTGRPRSQRAAVDPRLSARVSIAPGVAWLSTFGVSHQYPSLRVGNIPPAVLSVPGFLPGNAQLQVAMQGSQGFELALPAEIVLTATAFLSRWTGLTDLTADCVQLTPGVSGPRLPEAQGDPDPIVCPAGDPVHGRAYGLELLVRRSLTKRLTGWLSYTLSRSTRRARFITPSGQTDIATVPSESDRTHVLNAIAAYDLGRSWRVGGRFFFYTGSPYSNRDGSIPVPPYNAFRGPAFYRLDVRLEKRWRLGESGFIAFVLEGQNVTLQKEQGFTIDCRGEGSPEMSTLSCHPSQHGPITLPSVGVEASF